MPTKEIIIYKHGIEDPVNPYYNERYSNDTSFNRRVETLYEELLYKEYPFDKTMHLFLMNNEEAAKHLRREDQAMIHLSPNRNYQVTFREAGNIMHAEFTHIVKSMSFYNNVAWIKILLLRCLG